MTFTTGWACPTQKPYNGVKEFLVTAQFLDGSQPKLAAFLKKRKLTCLYEMAEFADRFVEAEGLKNLAKPHRNI